MTSFDSGSELRNRSRKLLDGFVRRYLVLILVLSAVLPVLSRHISKGEFNYNVDETQHAFTGVFVSDLLHDHPIHHPVEYAYRYYAHYPALSGVVHWPPLFYVFEGLVFFVVGPSVVAARVTILLAATVGLWSWFRLIEELHSTSTAIVATWLLAFSPSVLLFEKTVMLEIPALSLCILATYFWIKFLLKAHTGFLIWFAFSAALAMLTKQNSVYLFLFCFFSITALRKWRLLWRPATLVALAILLGLAGPYYYANYKLQWATSAPDLMEKQATGFQQITYYWLSIPQLIGWPLLILAIVGAVTCFWWNSQEKNFLFLSWIVSVYVTMTLIGHKEARYIICLVPAILYFALWPLVMGRTSHFWIRFTSLSALAGVMAFSVVSAWQYQRPYVLGFSPVAVQIRKIADSGVVLVDTAIPANLVFFIRLQDPARRFVVLRKSLYSVRIKDSLGSEEYVQTRQGLQQLVQDDGIRFIVVSNRPPEQFPIEVTLRDMLKTSQFRLVGQYPVEGNSPEWNHYSLSLYENTRWGPPVVPTLRIPMMTMGDDIIVPFKDLGITYAPQNPASTAPARHATP